MKTIKHIIWMAVLTLTVATWSACSNNDALAVTEEPVQPRTYTVTTTLSPKGGAQTRSTMTDNGDGSISAEWQENDQLSVYYYVSPSGTAETTATVTAVNPTTKAATITFTLTDPKDDGDITFGYPLSFYNHTKNPDTDQSGTLDDINDNFAAISCSGKMNVDGSVVTLSGLTTMEQEMCIWKFSFTDGSSDITSAITKLVIEFPENSRTYSVTPLSQSTIYVAMYGYGFSTPKSMSITAQTAMGVYRKAAASVTLAAGTTYTTTGLALKKAEVGKVFGADGNIYVDADAATAAGTTAVAMIAYVGNNTSEASPYNHGLALAMSDANSGAQCQWRTPIADAGHTKQSSSFTAESGLQYNDATHNSDTYPAFKAAIANNSTAVSTGCSAWFLPTGYQWNQMINACKNVLGTNNNFKDLRDGFSTRGGTNMQSYHYWSSSEFSANDSWLCTFGSDDGHWDHINKGWGLYVRSALAF